MLVVAQKQMVTLETESSLELRVSIKNRLSSQFLRKKTQWTCVQHKQTLMMDQHINNFMSDGVGMQLSDLSKATQPMLEKGKTEL